MVAALKMPSGLALTLRIIDWGMILYWSVMILVCLRIFSLPAEAMYDGYGLPVIDAWNWSFAPLDLGFAIAGLACLKLAGKGDNRWMALALISLALTFCAGLMAISFWIFKGEFNAGWWIPNLLLMAAALYWLPKLVSLEVRQ